MSDRQASTPEAYLASLPEERRNALSRVREVILENLPPGYEESISWGMVTYELPLERYPETYNKKPLMYAALAAQKNHLALYLTCAYQDAAVAERLRSAFAEAGKKLDMGKSCIRFQSAEELVLPAIGEAIASAPPETFIRQYEDARRKR